MAVQLAPMSPLWWVARLYDRLQTQRKYFDKMDAYYRGQPPRPPWLADQAIGEFHRLLDLTKSNYMGLVVDSSVEREAIEGFRIGDMQAADQPTWDIWQANNMDSASDQLLLEAAIGGCSFLLVAPNPDDTALPLMYAEHPTQAVVEYVPGTARRERAAGLKVWLDDWTGRTMATLYLPDAIYKYSAPTQPQGVTGNIRWEARQVRGERWPAPNPLGEVPLVELANNPRLLTGGVSEIDDLYPIQDRIGKTLADRLMTQDYGAFPQRFAIGYPDTDAEGNRNRIDIGRNRMITSDAPETRFGQFTAADLAGYMEAKREDVKDIASRSRVPAQYLLGEMSNISGEVLKASESGLVSKVRQRMRTFGEGFEDAVRLARKAAGMGGGDEAMETIWRNPEFRTEGELVDALTKMATLGVPHEVLWERWGASQVEIARWRDMLAEQDAAGLAQILKTPAPPAAATPADQVNPVGSAG